MNLEKASWIAAIVGAIAVIVGILVSLVAWLFNPEKFKAWLVHPVETPVWGWFLLIFLAILGIFTVIWLTKWLWPSETKVPAADSPADTGLIPEHAGIARSKENGGTAIANLPPALDHTVDTFSKKPKNTGYLIHNRAIITEYLQRFHDDKAANEVMLALDFCSFGAFGDFKEFERQTNLITSISHQLHDKYQPLRIIANDLEACQWQLEQFFSEEEWRKNGTKWKENNIPQFAKSELGRNIFRPEALAQILGKGLTREQWIKHRLDFEKGVEKNYIHNNARVTRHPGIVPFHTWLCKVTNGSPYGVVALCLHQTAASAEVAFVLGDEQAHPTIDLVEELFKANSKPVFVPVKPFKHNKDNEL